MKKLLLILLGTLLALNILAQTAGVSAIVDAGGEKIIKKSGSSNWAKVYKRKIKSTLYYLWYTTDSEGNGLNRGGQLKGTPTYSSLSAAEATIPAGYAVVEVPPNPNYNWEVSTLPGLINGTTDISSMNTMGLSVFPSSPVVPSGTIRAELWWGDAALFRGNAETIRSLGLATAFDHNRMFTAGTIPAAHRYTWNIAPDAYAAHSIEQVQTDGANEFTYMFGPGGTRRDKDNNVIQIPLTHWDIETAAWSEEKAAAFIKGFHNAAVAVNPNYRTIVYGKPSIRTFKPFWRQSTYWYDSDAVPDRKKLFPFMKSGTLYQEPMGGIDSYFANKNIYFNILWSYPSAPLPLSVGMYKKSGGVIQTDEVEERDFLDNNFSETLRGTTHTWTPNEGHEGDEVSPDQGPYKHWIHEAFLGVYGGYAHYANAIYSLRTLNATIDISNTINGPYKTCWMLRSTNESNSWSGNYRPLDRYTTKLYVVMGFMFADKVVWWGGWTGTYGFSDDGSGIFPAANEGSAYAQASIEGLESSTKNVHLGAERQSLAISYKIRALNRDFGLYGSSDKLCVFADPMQIQPRAEIIGVGRLKGNVIDLLIAEPRLDVGETLTVTVGNTVTGTTYTRTLNAGGVKDPLWETFSFPGAGTLNPAQVWIQYTTIKGVAVKKNGLHADI